MLLYVHQPALGLHWLATLLTGIISNVPGTVTYFKLEMRGEPFLPWDITQGDFAGVAGKVELDIQPTMLWTLAIFLVLLAASCFCVCPIEKRRAGAGASAARRFLGFWKALLVFGVYLNASMCEFFGIYSDMWMQDRYYKNYGVITGFMTNLQVLTSKRRRTTLKNRFWSWPPAWKRRPKRRSRCIRNLRGHGGRVSSGPISSL